MADLLRRTCHRRVRAGVIVFALASWMPLAAAPVREHAAPPPTAGETSFAVVELFTSQGCSSCPRADQSLARLGKQTGALAVFPIEWHVDYWDYLGWPDPYALPEAARRQRSYGRALSTRPYTPQLIINGREVVRPAQDFSRVHSAVLSALGPPAAPAAEQPTLLLAAPVHSERSVQIDYQVAGLPAGCILTVVAVETDLENFVPRGENTGRTLHHHNVVRGFATVDLGSAADESGRVRITLPHGVVRAASSIVGYVQQHNTLHIVAAARATPANPGASS